MYSIYYNVYALVGAKLPCIQYIIIMAADLSELIIFMVITLYIQLYIRINMAADLLVEGANLTALRKNEMHLPKPSKLAPRRNMVHLYTLKCDLMLSSSFSARDWWCLEAPPTSDLANLLHTLPMTTP